MSLLLFLPLGAGHAADDFLLGLILCIVCPKRLFVDMMQCEAAFFLHTLRSRIVLKGTGPDFFQVQLRKAPVYKRTASLGGIAVPPLRHAHPVAQLAFV